MPGLLPWDEAVLSIGCAKNMLKTVKNIIRANDQRGKYLLGFIILNILEILNRVNDSPFVNRTRRGVIDITVAYSSISFLVKI